MVPQGVATALWFVGILLIIFAIADIVLAHFMGIDITGVSWSPIASGIAGGLLMRFFSSSDDD